MTFENGVLAPADPPDLLPGWERLALPIVSAPVTGGRGGGPSSGTLLEVSGAELSSVRRTDEGDAEVRIQDHLMKQTGTSRLFVSPPLEPGRTFYYTVKATWDPNNYTKITRKKKVEIGNDATVTLDFTKADPKGIKEIPLKARPPAG